MPSIRRYAVRRAARILPAYWVAFGAVLLIAASVAWWQVPVHGLLLHGLVPNEAERVFFVAWTLGTEAVFYVLVPLGALLAWRLARRRRLSRAGVAAGIAVLWLATAAWGLVMAAAFPFDGGGQPAGGVLLLPDSLGNFCPGMLVFLAETASAGDRGRWLRLYRRLTSRPSLTLLLGVGFFVVAETLHWKTSASAFALTHPLTGVGSGLVLVGLLHAGWVGRLGPVVAPLGLVSYGLYLWHWVILMLLSRMGTTVVESFSPLATLGHAVILLVLTVPIALASWLLVERPLLRRTTLWDRRQQASEPKPPVVLADPLPAGADA